MVRVHFVNERELDLKHAEFEDVETAVEQLLNMEGGNNRIRYIGAEIIDNKVLINVDKITYIEEVK